MNVPATDAPPYEMLAVVPDDEHALAYLMQDGDLTVPGGRYGSDTSSCARVALFVAKIMRDATGEPMTYHGLESDMSSVVNSSDGVAELIWVHARGLEIDPADYISDEDIAACRLEDVEESDFDLESFIDGYVECALWADCMPADRCVHCNELVRYEPDATHVDQYRWRHAGEDRHDHVAERDDNAETGGCEDLTLRDGTRDRMAVDCRAFVANNLAILQEYVERCKSGEHNAFDFSEGPPESFAGHDFWLTRRCHGSGFWDRGLGELGKLLSKAARSYGEPDDHTLYDCGDGTADV